LILPIPGFPEYEAHSDGQIYSKYSRKFLKPFLRKANYAVGLVDFKTGIKHPKYVHLLIASLFLPNESNLQFVRHVDGDKLNNAVENLVWTGHKSKYKSHLLKPHHKRYRGIFKCDGRSACTIAALARQLSIGYGTAQNWYKKGKIKLTQT
jgi:hypothetical protein